MNPLSPRRPGKLHPGSLATLILLLAAGLGLRLWMLHKFFDVSGDSQVYGGIAKNLLLLGRYALGSLPQDAYPTLIRLPGYPFFLAACFRLFGMENYRAVVLVQIGLEILGCLLLGDLARRIASPRAGWATLALALLCPFTASYAILPLTESLTLFCIALALWSAEGFRRKRNWSNALGFTLAITVAALLRPDGAVAGVALAPAMLLACFPPRSRKNTENAPLSFWKRENKKKLLTMAAVCLLLATAPFAAWGARNWKVFHLAQPLAPRYATEPGEAINLGWIRWIKTWCLDFNCTYQVYWLVPGDVLNISALPERAFDSKTQYDATLQLAADYNHNGQQLTPDLDARFNQLAIEREQSHPWRSRLWMPLGRVADMWLRPRTENLPIDLDWWKYSRHHQETIFSCFYLGLNAALLLLALGGLWRRPALWPWMLLYALLRSLVLLTVEAPEARYTLECFPMIFVLGGVFLGQGTREQRSADSGQ
jgi:hypothetical protein